MLTIFARKLVAFLSVMLIVVSLAACGDTTATPSTTAGAVPATAATTTVPVTTSVSGAATTTAGVGGTTTFQGDYFSVSVPNGWVSENHNEPTPGPQTSHPSHLESVLFYNAVHQSQFEVLFMNDSYANLQAEFAKHTWTKSGIVQANNVSGEYGVAVNVQVAAAGGKASYGECLLPVPGDAAHAYVLNLSAPASGSNVEQDVAQFQQFCQSLVPVSAPK